MRTPLLPLAVLLTIGCAVADAEKERAWERVIQKFEAEDEATPPPAEPILFTGSSSIVLWKLDQAFPEWPVLNRGFGGSNFGDLNHFFERVVKRYDPPVLVVYSGDNDISSGQSADEVWEQVHKFAERVRTELPETELVLLSIKPSKARWSLYPEMQRVNEKMQGYAKEHERVQFVDLGKLLLDESGEPDERYFVGDRLHLNAEGYKVWTEALRPVLAPLVEKAAP